MALACLVAGHDPIGPLQQAERQPGQEALAFDEALAREQLQAIIILLNGQQQQQQQGGNYHPPAAPYETAIGSPSPVVVPSPSPYPSQQRPVVAHQQNAPMPVAPTYSAIPMVSSTAVAPAPPAALYYPGQNQQQQQQQPTQRPMMAVNVAAYPPTAITQRPTAAAMVYQSATTMAKPKPISGSNSCSSHCGLLPAVSTTTTSTNSDSYTRSVSQSICSFTHGPGSNDESLSTPAAAAAISAWTSSHSHELWCHHSDLLVQTTSANL